MKRIANNAQDPADNRFRIPPEHMAQLKTYRKYNGLPTVAAALREVLTLGFVQARQEALEARRAQKVH